MLLYLHAISILHLPAKIINSIKDICGWCVELRNSKYIASRNKREVEKRSVVMKNGVFKTSSSHSLCLFRYVLDTT